MFAIIETGGKQYKVKAGDEVLVEKLDAEVGQTVEFDALYVENEGQISVGTPVVEGVKVKAEVVEHGKGKKIVVFKYKPKKRQKTKQGHRQPYTKLRITNIG